MRLLEQIISSLPEAQRLAIQSLLQSKRKSGYLRSLRQREEEAQRLAASLRGKLGKQIFDPKYPSPGDMISSEKHNTNLEGVYLDLNALYTHIEQLAKQGRHGSVTLASEYSKSRAAVEKLITDVKSFSLRKKFPEFNEVKVLDFNSSRNLSTARGAAEVNPQTRLLELMPLVSTRAELLNRGSRSTRVYTRTISPGIRGALQRNFPPELMIDKRPETFWGTLILSDSYIDQVYNQVTSGGLATSTAVRGPVVEVYLRFSHAEKINVLKLLPFAEYPLRLLDISYRSTASTQVFTAIENFEEVSTLDWVEINFTPIFAHEIRVTIAQENPRKVLYHLPKKIVSNTDLLYEIIRIRAENLVGAAVINADIHRDLLSLIDSYTSALDAVEDLLNLAHIDLAFTPDIEYTEDFITIINHVLKDIDSDSKVNIINSYLDEPEEGPGEEIIEVKKYEYILGIAELEAGYVLYAPTSPYESESLGVQATVSEIQLEVDERHIQTETAWESGMQFSSTEWSIDIGGGRVLPIHPRNVVDDQFTAPLPAVKDERLLFDRNNRVAFTRLGSRFANLTRLKKDGQVIPTTDYAVERQIASIPNLKVTLSGQWFDENGVYTTDYVVDKDSYDIQILEQFNSRVLDSPEIFTEFNTDNDIILGKYPYIDYEVINRTGVFDKDLDTATWKWRAPQADKTTGQFLCYPTIIDAQGAQLTTGSYLGATVTGTYGTQSGLGPLLLFGNSGLASGFFATPEFGYYIALSDLSTAWEISGFSETRSHFQGNLDGFTGLSFIDIPVLTKSEIEGLPSGAFSGDLGSTPATGFIVVDYTLGVGLKTDDQVFSFANPEYTPVIIKVGNTLATNITDYEALEHPAFSISSLSDNNYEYIHAGNRIYFSQSNKGQDVSVSYRWITEYVKVLGTLRCNKALNPDITPKVNEIRVLTNNLVI